MFFRVEIQGKLESAQRAAQVRMEFELNIPKHTFKLEEFHPNGITITSEKDALLINDRFRDIWISLSTTESNSYHFLDVIKKYTKYFFTFLSQRKVVRQTCPQMVLLN